MRDIDYATAVARIRINENNLLTNSEIDRLISAKSISDAVSLLNDKGYSSQNEPVENLFDGQMEKAWALVNEVAPDADELNFLLVKNDFHNLKAILKGVITDKSFEKLCLHPTITKIEDIEVAVREQRFDRLPEYMRDVAKQAYNDFVSTGDGQLSDIVIDKGALSAIVSLSKSNHDSFMSGLGEIIAATYNLRIAVSCANIGQDAAHIRESLCSTEKLDASALSNAAAMGMDELTDFIASTSYSQAAQCLKESVASFEKWCDDALIKYIEPVKYSCFGAAPLAAYIIKKEAELKTVRIIVSGILTGMDEAKIRQRVRRVG